MSYEMVNMAPNMQAALDSTHVAFGNQFGWLSGGSTIAYIINATLRSRLRAAREVLGTRVRGAWAVLMAHALPMLFTSLGVGATVLTAMVLVVSVGPLHGLTLDQKLGLLQIIGGVVGFSITLFAVLVALEEFRSSTARPDIRLTLVTRPKLVKPGMVDWAMRWNVRSEGDKACQWFSLELAIGWVTARAHMFPNGTITVVGADAPMGGRWSQREHTGSPPQTPGGFPAWYYYMSNGQVSVFDHVGVDVGGPTFQIDSDEPEISISCILRGSGAPARHYDISLNPADGSIIRQSESAMPRHRPGAR